MAMRVDELRLFVLESASAKKELENGLAIVPVQSSRFRLVKNREDCLQKAQLAGHDRLSAKKCSSALNPGHATPSCMRT